AANKCAGDVGHIGLLQVGDKASSAAAYAAQGKGRYGCKQQYADHIIPVKQLEPKGFTGYFLCVGPRAPAKHSDYEKQHSHSISVYNEHKLIIIKGLYIIESRVTSQESRKKLRYRR